MIVIRKEQVETLARTSFQAFEVRTYAHLLEYFPRHCALLGPAPIHALIRLGAKKAQSHGLTAERCLRTYIEFMCMLGSGFDVDPLLPWAAGILKDRGSSDQIARADRLYDRAWEYISHIVPDYRDAAGQPTTARFIAQLRRLRDLPDDPLTIAAMPAFCSGVVQWIESVFPAKYRYVGADAVARMVAQAIETAGGYGISGLRGVTTVVMFMFVLGRGFDEDPLLPWAYAALHEPDVPGSRRSARLYAEGVSFLRRWWDSAPREES